MNEETERMSQKRVVLADGRYLIFYRFGPCERVERSLSAGPIPQANKAAEEN